MVACADSVLKKNLKGEIRDSVKLSEQKKSLKDKKNLKERMEMAVRSSFVLAVSLEKDKKILRKGWRFSVKVLTKKQKNLLIKKR